MQKLKSEAGDASNISSRNLWYGMWDTGKRYFLCFISFQNSHTTNKSGAVLDENGVYGSP